MSRDFLAARGRSALVFGFGFALLSFIDRSRGAPASPRPRLDRREPRGRHRAARHRARAEPRRAARAHARRARRAARASTARARSLVDAARDRDPRHARLPHHALPPRASTGPRPAVHTLSHQTKKVLDGLEQDVEVTALVPGVEQAPPARELLDKYATRASPRFKVEYVDPQRAARPARAARRSTPSKLGEGGLVRVAIGGESVEVSELDEDQRHQRDREADARRARRSSTS